MARGFAQILHCMLRVRSYGGSKAYAIHQNVSKNRYATLKNQQ